MVKNDPLTARNSNELIIYQLGEVKNLVTSLDLKVDKNQDTNSQTMDKMDKRVTALEIWQAGQVERAKNAPIDVTKIVLAVLGIAGTAITLAFTAIKTGVVK